MAEHCSANGWRVNTASPSGQDTRRSTPSFATRPAARPMPTSVRTRMIDAAAADVPRVEHARARNSPAARSMSSSTARAAMAANSRIYRSVGATAVRRMSLAGWNSTERENRPKPSRTTTNPSGERSVSPHQQSTPSRSVCSAEAFPSRSRRRRWVRSQLESRRRRPWDGEGMSALWPGKHRPNRAFRTVRRGQRVVTVEHRVSSDTSA